MLSTQYWNLGLFVFTIISSQYKMNTKLLLNCDNIDLLIIDQILYKLLHNLYYMSVFDNVVCVFVHPIIRSL